MADKKEAEEPAVSEEAPPPIQPSAVVGVTSTETKTYTFNGPAEEIFHRAAGEVKKGDQVELTQQQADELTELGFELTE
jgi:hypothetical protein